MHAVWEIDALRKEIFSYLRRKPYASCSFCHRPIFWNPGRKLCMYVRMHGGSYMCVACARIEAHVNVANCAISFDSRHVSSRQRTTPLPLRPHGIYYIFFCFLTDPHYELLYLFLFQVSYAYFLNTVYEFHII